MIIEIDNRYGDSFTQALARTVEAVCRKSLVFEGFPEAAEISVTIVDDEEIWRINKNFRKKDSPTDVLSFPMIDFERGETPPVDMPYLLGDIIISMDTAIKQAQTYGHSIVREVGFLTAHSMLHLMGYDHENGEEEKEMFAAQEAILGEIGLKR